jgi:SulP family sulfate permease
MDGLIIATFMAGLILVAIGLLRVGTAIRYIPYPVTVGFTAGIAIIIAASQIRDLLGLVLARPEPPDFVHKVPVLLESLGTFNPYAFALGAGTIAIILVLRRYAPRAPGLLLAIAAASAVAFVLSLPMETISSRFGVLSSSLNVTGLPPITLVRLRDLIVPALAIALLGGIESLLSAVVADGMSGHRHRSNCELVAQGLANMASALCGGICVTGTIARTATNVRSGARGPVAGMMHAVFLAVFLMVGGSLIAVIPLAALAGLLLVVAWNMAERREIDVLSRTSRGDALVLWSTLLLTVLVDLTVGIMAGVVLGSVLVIHRMAQALDVQLTGAVIEDDEADVLNRVTPPVSSDVVTFRVSGAFFFGTAATVGATLDRIGAPPKVFVLDLSAVSFLDTTGAHTLAAAITRMRAKGVTVEITGARADIRDVLEAFGV